MSFLDDIRTGSLFSQRAAESHDRTDENLKNSLRTLPFAYYDHNAMFNAMAHPFLHLAQLLRNAARFIYGAFVLTGALVTGHWWAAGKVGLGMLQLLHASIGEMLNIVFTSTCFVLRGLNTMCRGYESNPPSSPDEHNHDDNTKETLPKNRQHTVETIEEMANQSAWKLV